MLAARGRAVASRRVALIVCAAMSLTTAACTTFRPQAITCDHLGAVPVHHDAAQRLAVDGFSVRPPVESHWCRVPSIPSEVVFVSNEFVDRYLERPPGLADWNHTFAVVARRLLVDQMRVRDEASLAGFTRRWLARGQAATFAGGQWYADLSPVGRFVLIDARVTVAPRAGADCVRYEASFEEIDNPARPGWVLTLRGVGLLCRDPRQPGVLVGVEFSERHRSGHQRPELRAQFLREALVTLDSLELAPP
jgi:hypothetical protein